MKSSPTAAWNTALEFSAVNAGGDVDFAGLENTFSGSDELLDTLAAWNSVLKSIEPPIPDRDQP